MGQIPRFEDCPRPAEDLAGDMEIRRGQKRRALRRELRRSALRRVREGMGPRAGGRARLSHCVNVKEENSSLSRRRGVMLAATDWAIFRDGAVPPRNRS